MRLLTTPRLPLLVVLLSICACDEGPGGQVGDLCNQPGYVCSTVACSQFPTMSGCTTVRPDGSYCPVDRYHCWDPRTGTGYCDPAVSRCAKGKSPPGVCAPRICTLQALTDCFDTNDELFCGNGYNCQSFTCTADGGTDDAGGTEDMSVMDDMSLPSDSAAADM